MSGTPVNIATLFLAIVLTACSSFDADQLRAHIRTELPAQDTTPRVIAGEVAAIVKTLRDDEKIFVGYYDSTAQLTVVNGWIDSVATRDTMLVFSNTEGTIPPQTLSVAMRMVGGVYKPSEHPEMRSTDAAKTVFWVLFGLPTFMIGTGLLFAAPAYSSGSLETVGTVFLVGALLGFVVWAVLTK
jgi:hypothetical protein